ncbi:hypothetical protein BRD00_15480 [Halobacteriales archaeon QS_8_69_26]|nr:MAG: hypothetical protein BRD00_15480 [Halobacteriales archaeon QS_8_69_26]
MHECDYCDAEFDDEDAYLDHLGDEHEGELGLIDRRRVEGKDDEGGIAAGPIVIALVLGISIAGVLGATYLFSGGGGGAAGADTSANPDGIEAEPLPNSGNPSLLEDVESHPSEGGDHVPESTDPDYDFPPTSGDHYRTPAFPGFYEKTPALGHLVHSLEHGAIVIYYDPASTSDDAEQSLREFAAQHTDPWASVVVVENPVENPESTYVLTAWRHSLRMDDYDPEVVRAFIAEYIGRGPENPVR